MSKVRVNEVISYNEPHVVLKDVARDREVFIASSGQTVFELHETFEIRGDLKVYVNNQSVPFELDGLDITINPLEPIVDGDKVLVYVMEFTPDDTGQIIADLGELDVRVGAVEHLVGQNEQIIRELPGRVEAVEHLAGQNEQAIRELPAPDQNFGDSDEKPITQRLSTLGTAGVAGVISRDYTAQAFDLRGQDTSEEGFTVTLPVSPQSGDFVTIMDVAGAFEENTLTVVSDKKIMGLEEELVCDVSFFSGKLVYINEEFGWRLV